MKHMEEMKIAGLAMALCIVMLGIYIVVPKDGTTSHLTAIPDNNAAQPATDSTSQGQGSTDTGNDGYFPIYTVDSYDNSYSDGSGDNGDSDTDNNYSNDNSGDTADNSDYNTDSSDNGDNGDDEVTDETPSDDSSDNTDNGTGDVIDDSSDTGDASDSDLGNDIGDTGNDDTVEIY